MKLDTTDIRLHKTIRRGVVDIIKTDFRNQLASHVINQKYKVAKVYVSTGRLLGMKPFPPFVRLMVDWTQTEYSLMMDEKVRIFNSNWSRK